MLIFNGFNVFNVFNISPLFKCSIYSVTFNIFTFTGRTGE